MKFLLWTFQRRGDAKRRWTQIRPARLEPTLDQSLHEGVAVGALKIQEALRSGDTAATNLVWSAS